MSYRPSLPAPTETTAHAYSLLLTNNKVGYDHYPAEGYGIKYEGSFLEKNQSGCVQNFCHFVCLHHFWA